MEEGIVWKGGIALKVAFGNETLFEMEKLLGKQHFVLFPQCLLPYDNNFHVLSYSKRVENSVGTLRLCGQLPTTQFGLLTTPRKKPFENIVGKREIAGNQHLLLFSTMFSTLSKTENIISAIFILLSGNAFNLVMSKILLFGEELTHSHTMTSFDAPGKQAFWKHRGKRRNCS